MPGPQRPTHAPPPDGGPDPIRSVLYAWLASVGCAAVLWSFVLLCIIGGLIVAALYVVQHVHV